MSDKTTQVAVAITAAAGKKRRLGDPPFSQLRQRQVSSPLALPTALSAIVCAFLPIVEAIPASPGEGTPDTKVVRTNNAKIVCKQFAEWMWKQRKEQRVHALVMDRTWDPLLQHGLRACTQALTSMFTPALVQGLSVETDKVMPHTADTMDFVRRFRHLQRVSVTLNSYPMGLRDALAMFLTLTSLHTLKVHVVGVGSWVNYLLRASSAPLTHLSVRSSHFYWGAPQLEPLLTWPRIERLVTLEISLIAGDSHLAPILARCHELVHLKLRMPFGSRTDPGMDVNRYLRSVTESLVEAKSPIATVRLHVSSNGHRHGFLEAPKQPYVTYAELIRSWKALRNVNVVLQTPNEWPHLRDNADTKIVPEVQDAVVAAIRSCPQAAYSYFLLHPHVCVSAAALQQTAHVAARCDVDAMVLADEAGADLSFLAKWCRQHPRCEFVQHIAKRYRMSGDAAAATEIDWKAIGSALAIARERMVKVQEEQMVRLEFSFPCKLSDMAAMITRDSPSLVLVGLEIKDTQMLRIDDVSLPEVVTPCTIVVSGTFAFSARLFESESLGNLCLVFCRADDVTRRFMRSDAFEGEHFWQSFERAAPDTVVITTTTAQETVQLLYSIDARTRPNTNRWTAATALMDGFSCRVQMIKFKHLTVWYVEAAETAFTQHQAIIVIPAPPRDEESDQEQDEEEQEQEEEDLGDDM